MTAAAQKKEVTIGGSVGIPPAGAVALRSLTMRNVLSFGAEATVELGALNVLIGANGCGKSNLMDVIALLKAAAGGELSDEFRGKALEWPWKGESMSMPGMCVVSEWKHGPRVYRHDMTVNVRDSGEYSINPEWLGLGTAGARRIIGQKGGRMESVLRGRIGGLWVDRRAWKNCPYDDPSDFHRDCVVAMSDVHVYRARYVGRTGRGQNPLRVAGTADKLNKRVSESLDNFPNVLNRVYAVSECREFIDEKIREFYEDARDLYFSVAHGAVEMVLRESGGRSTPASRMSDGMLNWLFLLTVLLDPKPPALVCIDEPETGMHPDMLPTLARMLIDASSRTQLVVATHSDMLVDCFADLPEAVVVCDKEDGVTQMKRLTAEEFQDWKEEGLGMAWISGAIGGTRW